MDEDIKAKNEEEKGNEEKRKRYQFTQSPEWKSVKKSLIEKLMLADSCSLIDEKLSNQEAGELARVNAKVVKMVTEWIQDIEGDADMYLEMIDSITEEKKENLIFKKVEE
ncbi:MAG: hypothetical protein [Siphoviridae sp. cttb18]|nr:MAG: hypothetical protein [Siphoviridae sp. cttb18]